MGSSSGGDYSTPPRGPAPPASSILPQGQSTPYKPNFISFLGDTNTPSTGLTPDMLSAIDATNGPPPGSMPPPMPPPGLDELTDLRNQLAAMQARKPQQQQPYGMRERGGGSGRAGGSSGAGGRGGGGWGGR